jgi:hypothetical protein
VVGRVVGIAVWSVAAVGAEVVGGLAVAVGGWMVSAGNVAPGLCARPDVGCCSGSRSVGACDLAQAAKDSSRRTSQQAVRILEEANRLFIQFSIARVIN